ncbi:agamous-like MADS-box protein AGL104 [Henckelia pumila]|uniref:agamous-like MADS-box protein AGL104 n=1 Tax=Henckelia pumila TaxID=405737 RepID=UPI003C6E076C
MGRKKLAMRRIENATTRQLTYTKRKDGIVKKASELSVLCDTDVAVVMFSPTGKLTTFASDGRVEDIFLRFVDRPDELRGGPITNEEFLSEKLKQLKYEGQMLEKIAMHIYRGLEENLDKLCRRQREAHEKLRYYEPVVEKINTVLEAGVYQQFLTSAIQRVQLSKAKLLGNKLVSQATENNELQTATVPMEDTPASVTRHDINQNGASTSGKDHEYYERGAMGPQLSLSFIEAQKQWNPEA